MLFRTAGLLLIALKFCSVAHAQSEAQLDSLDALFKQKDYESVIRMCDRILAADPGQVNALSFKGTIYLQQKNYRQAAETYGRAARLYPDPNFLTNAAFSYLLTGVFDSTEFYCRLAISRYPEDFNNYLNLAHSYYLRDSFRMAELYYDLANSYLPHREQMLEAVKSDLQLLDSIKPSNAINTLREFFSKSYEAYGANSASNQILDSIYSTVFSEEPGRDKEMLRLKRNFIAAQENEKSWRFQALRDFYYTLAEQDFYYDRKKFKGMLEQGIGMDRYLGDSISLFNSLIKFSDLLINAAVAVNPVNPEYSEAFILANEANNLADSCHLPQKYLALMQMGSILYESNEYADAIQLYKMALPLTPKSKVYGSYEEVLGYIMIANSLMGNYEEADRYFDLVIKREPEVKDTGYEFLTLRMQHLRNSYYKKKYREVIADFYSLIANYPHNERTIDDLPAIYETAGLSYMELARADSAIMLFKESIKLYNEYSKQLIAEKAPGMPKFSSIDRKDALMSLKHLLGKANDIDGVFEWVERSKDNLLTYWLSGEANPESVNSLVQMQKEIPPDAAGILFFNVSNGNGAGLAFNSTAKKMQQHDSTSLLREFGLDKNYAAIRKADRGKFNGYLLVSLPLRLFSYLSRKDIVTRGGMPVSTKTGKVENPDDWRISISKLLYRYFIKPYEPILEGKKTVYISTDESLNYIPFEALMDENGRYFGEKYSVIYVPSFHIRKLLEGRETADAKNMFLFGNPDYDSYHPDKHSALAWDFALDYGIRSWADLPGTKLELDAVSAIWKNARSFQHNKLSESAIKNLSSSGALKEAGIIHFALHGFNVIDIGPEGNTIIVSEPDSGEEDGLLNFWEASHLDIHARLVVLSACETAFGIPRDDGSSITMTSAFLVAGAAACVGTNWSISDHASMLFMKEFYSLIKKGIDIPEALHQVKKKFISGTMGAQYRSPYYWAAFKYYGK